MKKSLISCAGICLSLCMVAFSGCGMKNNSTTAQNSTVQQTTVASETTATGIQTTTDGNTANSQITVTEIDTDTIKNEYTEMMTQDGVYVLKDNNEIVIASVNPDGYEYDVDVRVNGSEVSVKYETEHSDDRALHVDDDAYLIRNVDENTVIKVYKDNQETSFVKEISCDGIFK